MTGRAAFIGGLADIATKVVDKVGLPGTFILLAYLFVERNASAEQKEAIINMYVLGEELGSPFPLVAFAVLSAIAIIGQYLWYRQKLKIKSAEIDRLSGLKSSFQQDKIGTPLHHS